VRDFDATLRGRHEEKGDMIVRMMERAYVFHLYAGTSFYPDSILTSLLHINYLKQVHHPGWDAFVADPQIASEEHGEITLSLLSNAMLNTTCKSLFTALRKAYIAVGAGAQLNKHNMESLGISTKNREHVSSDVQHVSTVALLIPHLRSVARTYLMHEKYSCFVVDDEDVTAERVAARTNLQRKRSWAQFFRRNLKVDGVSINTHVQNLCDRYFDNDTHPQIADHLLQLVGDNRYLGKPLGV